VKNNNQVVEQQKNLTNAVTDKNSPLNCIYSKPVIIWIHPTVRELDSITTKMTKEGNTSFEEDYSYYNTEAQSFLGENGNKYLVTDSVNIYKFVLNKDTILIDKRTLTDCPWKIILFNGIEKPIMIAPINIEDAYRNYFKKNRLKLLHPAFLNGPS
jgi:hypothetical protein